jgi:hypothetical protein
MAKKQSHNGAKDVQARVKRAESAIDEILKRERVVITANKVRVLFAGENGKYSGGSAIDVKDFAKLLNRPNMLIMPQVQLEAKQEPAP